MCWINVQDQMPADHERVDLFSPETGRVPDCFRAGDTWYKRFNLSKSYMPAMALTEEQYTHWRYPPAPPESAND